MLRTDRLRIVASILLGAVAIACTPTPPPGGGGGGGGGGVTTDCALVAVPGGPGLAADCIVSGAPANRQIDPANTQSSACSLTSLTLFDQSVSANARLVYGENGDESPSRVRIGVSIADGSSHSGRLAKSAGTDCDSTIPPVATISTTFAGTHVALIDKQQVPHCVFRSRFVPSQFEQSLSLGFAIDPSLATRAATRNAIAQTLDLEAARATNRLRGNADAMDAAFVRRAGRCQNDYAVFRDGD